MFCKIYFRFVFSDLPSDRLVALRFFEELEENGERFSTAVSRMFNVQGINVISILDFRFWIEDQPPRPSATPPDQEGSF
jgi:hypothetical protein